MERYFIIIRRVCSRYFAVLDFISAINKRLKSYVSFRNGTIGIAFLVALFIGSLVVLPHFVNTEDGIAVSPSPGEAALAIAPPDGLSFPLDATKNDGFGSGTVKVNVSTTSLKGYTLFMNSQTSNNALVLKTNETQKLQSITANTAKANLPDNTWGYSLDDTLYHKIPTSDGSEETKVIAQTSTPSDSDNYDVIFGAKINFSATPGIYTNTVVFSAVSNSPIYTITLDDSEATTPGTDVIYETFGVNYSLLPGGITATSIVKPIKAYTYSINYNMNDTGIAAPTGPTSATRNDTFNGYYSSTSGGDQIIDADGPIIADSTYFTDDDTIYAHWSDGAATVTLPALAKDHYDCKWAKDSATGEQLDPGSDVTLTSNTTYYAVCVPLYTWYKYSVDYSATGHEEEGEPVVRSNIYGYTLYFCSSKPELVTSGEHQGEFRCVQNNPVSGDSPSSAIGKYYITGADSQGLYSYGTAYYEVTNATYSSNRWTLYDNTYHVEHYSKGSTSYGTVTSIDPNAYPENGTPDNIYWYMRGDLSLSDVKTMQEMTPTICSNSAENETAQLRDIRDNDDYIVKKLADGNCWMTENLRLGGSNSIILTNADTNMSASTWTLPASGTANFDNNGYTNAAVNADYENIVQTAKGSSPAGKIGDYYNFCAASAGTYCYASGYAPKNVNATEDICPKGWRMPTSGNSGEYQTLYAAYSSNVASFQAALVTPLSGYFNSGSAQDRGSNGYAWSSTRGSSDYMYHLYIFPSDVITTDDGYRYRGYSLRCTAQS